MIHKAVKGQGFRGVLNYVEGKDGAHRIGGNMAGDSARSLAAEFRAVRELRPNLRQAVYHVSLRAAPGEQISAEQWRAIGDRFMVGMGFGESPYVIYYHVDAREEHIHIIASRITYLGRVVSDSNDRYRGMKILRAIEADYGLRVVPHEDTALRAPGQKEYKLMQEHGEPSDRSHVQHAVQRAVAGKPNYSTFAARLAERGITPTLHVASTGRVQGISFAYRESIYKGSGLGRTCSWQGLLRQGLTYHPERDRPRLAPAATRALAESSPAPSSFRALPSEADTLRQVDEQLRALGSARFDLQLLHLGTGARDARAAARSEILAQVEELRQKNRDGWDVLVRPVDARHHLITEVSRERLEVSRTRGFEPAAVVAVGADRHQVWFLDREATPAAERPFVTALLAREVGVDPRRAPADFGHLAGFVSHGEQLVHRLPAPPEVAVVEAPGTSYSAYPATLASAARLVEDRRTEAAVTTEVRSIAEISREAKLSVALDGAAHHRELAGRWQEASEGFEQARTRFAAAPQTAANAGRVIDAYRHLRETVAAVEILDGRPVPERLAPAELPEYLHLRARLAAPLPPDPPGADPEPVAQRTTRQVLTDRLAALAGSSDPAHRVEAILRREDDQLLGAWRASRSPQAALAAEIDLEAHRYDLRSSVRQLAADLEPRRIDLERAEAALRRAPTDRAIASYRSALAEYLPAEQCLLDAEQRSRGAESLAHQRDLARAKRVSPNLATTEASRTPSSEALRSAQEVGFARSELAAAVQAAEARPRSPEASRRVAVALHRFTIAQDRLSEHLASVAPGRSGSLESLIERVRAGDGSAQILASLERRLAAEVLHARRPLPHPAPPPWQRYTVARLARDYEAARSAVSQQLQRIPPGAPPSPEQAARLHRAVATLRSRAEAVERLGGRLREPASPALPVQAFLRHPSFANRTDALRAWALHAARRGLGEPEIRRTVWRQARRHSSTALRLGLRGAGAVASTAVYWAARAALWSAKQLARSR